MGLGLTIGAYAITVIMSGVFIETENINFNNDLAIAGYKLKNRKDNFLEFVKRNIVSLIPIFNIFFSSILMYARAHGDHHSQIDRLLKNGELEKIEKDIDSDNNELDNKENKTVVKDNTFKNNRSNNYDYAIERANNLHCKPKCLKKVKRNK